MACPCCFNQFCLSAKAGCVYTIAFHTSSISIAGSAGNVSPSPGPGFQDAFVSIPGRAGVVGYGTPGAVVRIPGLFTTFTYSSTVIAGRVSDCPTNLPYDFRPNPFILNPVYRTEYVNQNCTPSQDSGGTPSGSFHLFAYSETFQNFYDTFLNRRRLVLWKISIDNSGAPVATVAWDGFFNPASPSQIISLPPPCGDLQRYDIPPGDTRDTRCIPCNYPNLQKDPDSFNCALNAYNYSPFGNPPPTCPYDFTGAAFSVSVSCPP
jgi:hypothetical protein